MRTDPSVLIRSEPPMVRALPGPGPSAPAAPVAVSHPSDGIRAALAKSGGRKGEAAALLGTSPTTLWRRMHGLGI